MCPCTFEGRKLASDSGSSDGTVAVRRRSMLRLTVLWPNVLPRTQVLASLYAAAAALGVSNEAFLTTFNKSVPTALGLLGELFRSCLGTTGPAPMPCLFDGLEAVVPTALGLLGDRWAPAGQGLAPHAQVWVACRPHPAQHVGRTSVRAWRWLSHAACCCERLLLELRCPGPRPLQPHPPLCPHRLPPPPAAQPISVHPKHSGVHPVLKAPRRPPLRRNNSQ